MIISRKLKCPHCNKDTKFSRVKVGFFTKALPVQCNFCQGMVVYSSKSEWVSISGFVLVIGSSWFLRWNSVLGLVMCVFSIVVGAVLMVIAIRRKTLVKYSDS